MIKTIKILLFIIFCYSMLFPFPAYSNAERYDKLLARLEREKYTSTNEYPNISEPHKWVLTFEHEKLPILDGTWIIKKKTVKRKETLLKKPISHVHCNSRLPFEERPFEKEVVISPQGQDFFVFRALYPTTHNTFMDLTKTKNIEYQTYGLKGVVIPGEITYVYTLKLINHLENPSLARQLWFNGKLTFDTISEDKISGKGYEIEYTPECIGFIREEIVFELVKQSSLVTSNF